MHVYTIKCVKRSMRTCFVFFQAEDGIRDFHVTGVQTCALPISRRVRPAAAEQIRAAPRAEGLGASLAWLERAHELLAGDDPDRSRGNASIDRPRAARQLLAAGAVAVPEVAELLGHLEL